MSEPARQYAQHDPASRPQPGPLRDWLAAMKAATSSSSPDASPPSAPRESARIAEPNGEARGSDSGNQWIPRVVAPASPPTGAAQSDVSDLMAENIMLKAKLKVENDRYDALQGVIARELRNLRAHVEEDMQELDTVRAERDRLADAQATFEQQVRELRIQIAADAANLAEMRSERDLWAARAEALAQPIFQKRAAI
ncbi:hypothetical protein [Methylobacterium sp. J-068]|uniref:hypothetical protein n=1 Tax=Methylobacterium sp. J-068 TaxID=2836649 RepID=UPI001FBA7A8B|nr:hypothetical protein [Methylobacterium sp. J-068]MCJ2033025.1 hypothetical protein [Methylobacterium sp. J-068]